MKIKSPVSPRMQKRAEKECRIVDACKIRAQEMSESALKRLDDAKARLTALDNELAAVDPNNSVRMHQLTRALEVAERMVYFTEGCFLNADLLKDVMEEISLQSEALMQMGWCKYLVHTIPERKLPRLLYSEDGEDLKKVTSVVLSILQKIFDKLGLNRNVYEEFSHAARKTQMADSIMAESASRAHSAQAADIMARSKARLAAKMAESAPTPVPAEAPAKKTNKA